MSVRSPVRRVIKGYTADERTFVSTLTFVMGVGIAHWILRTDQAIYTMLAFFMMTDIAGAYYFGGREK